MNYVRFYREFMTVAKKEEDMTKLLNTLEEIAVVRNSLMRDYVDRHITTDEYSRIDSSLNKARVIIRGVVFHTAYSRT